VCPENEKFKLERKTEIFSEREGNPYQTMKKKKSKLQKLCFV
jgi:hypothetical protein